MAERDRSRFVGALLGMVLGAGLFVAAPAKAHHYGIEEEAGLPDCDSELGDPDPGTPEWDTAFYNTVDCRNERPIHHAANLAVEAAAASNAAAGSDKTATGDPFRDTIRWAGKRGVYTEFTWLLNDEDVTIYPTDVAVDGVPIQHKAALLRPLDLPPSGKLPGVIWLCHSCFPRPADNAGWEAHIWVPQTLVEHGYMVLMVDIGSQDPVRGNLAIDFFLSTPTNPAPEDVDGEHRVNPWYNLLDRDRIGLISHSGGAGLIINLGNTRLDIDAIVYFDRAGSYDPEAVPPRVPTMMQLADNVSGDVPPAAKPTYNPGSKYSDYDAFAAAGVDAMKVVLRGTTHVDWLDAACAGAGGVQYGGCTMYGAQVASYYMLAWFDRYLRGQTDPAVAEDALRRLTATDTFDGSSDVHSISSGWFDPLLAALGQSVERGNVPIKILGKSIRRRLSFWYDSKYFLDGGALECDDLRAGCP